MAKNKEVGTPVAETVEEVTDQVTTLDEVDFNELVEVERNVRTVEARLDKSAGLRARLLKEMETLYNQEQALLGALENKRKDLIKRYKIDDKKEWMVDVNTHQVVYKNK